MAVTKSVVGELRRHRDDRALLVDVLRILRDGEVLAGEDVATGLGGLSAGSVRRFDQAMLEELLPARRTRLSTRSDANGRAADRAAARPASPGRPASRRGRRAARLQAGALPPSGPPRSHSLSSPVRHTRRRRRGSPAASIPFFAEGARSRLLATAIGSSSRPAWIGFRKMLKSCRHVHSLNVRSRGALGWCGGGARRC